MTETNFSNINLEFVEELYEKFLNEPSSVPPEWQRIFEEWKDEPRPPAPSFKSRSIFHPPTVVSTFADDFLPGSVHATSLRDRVIQIIRAYRFRGHTIAQLDPLGQKRPVAPELDVAYYNFTEDELNQKFTYETFGLEPLTVREVLQKLQNTYARSIGVEYMHIDDINIRRWLQERMEASENHIQLTRDEQLRILTRLSDAVIFEEFIRKKFIGAKSFSLEGSESLIPMLDLAIEKAAEQGVTEIVLGMAHRGRLNVLANIMGKHPKQIFREFADMEPERYRGSGDVKYHLGHSTEWKTAAGKQVHLSLCFNPSHLEFVNPIVLGRTRGNQERTADQERTHNLAILIHGDAAFAGQGIIQEVLNLSNLNAYSVGGTLHIIVNNQIGFTTSPNESRSTMYATDVAKMLQIPIYHVNGEDPEAVAQVIRLAMDFRHKFKTDIVIDVYGYRRLGHNESDEPSFTQPELYHVIEKRKTVREGYLDHLLTLGGVTRAEADQIAEHRREHLEQELADSRHAAYRSPKETINGVWSNYIGGPEANAPEVKTGVDQKRLVELLEAQAKVPADFQPHPKIKKLLETRRGMAAGKQPLDWAAAEALAFASLVAEGSGIRMSGQDAERGTFSHRHAVLHDYRNGKTYMPLKNVSDKQATVNIYNSPLSETSVLGFELGYSMEWPDSLVIWEAQFGDFVNVAQVIIDQFLVSAEKKWKRYSGLVMLLPHGFEGQGPEHSSARLERFLALAAEDNMQIVYPTTPAQFFHLIRRQVVRRWRKPLIVMSPKSLLRHPKVVSSMEELANGTFQRIIPDAAAQTQTPDRILLCSGKLFYELEKFREDQQRNDVAILRIEQLYPLPKEILENALSLYPAGTPVYWVQEEPENMGAWRYMLSRFGENLLGRHPFAYVGRPSSASPATGSHNSHKQEQEQLVTEAFGPNTSPRNPKENHYANRIESPVSR
ncbi:MAG: 2-oxoglutarate dehydrogenase, subunit [Verrucomicrobiales bacterium]|nr:2-oxoglutarate dehydrogenase, subunit [Verrucomicrobiales bacterium]